MASKIGTAQCPMKPNLPLKFQLDRLNLTPVRARGKSNSKTDGQTDRQTHRRIVENHFSRRFMGCTSQIRSYLVVDFLHDANTSIDMEVKLEKIAENRHVSTESNRRILRISAGYQGLLYTG